MRFSQILLPTLSLVCVLLLSLFLLRIDFLNRDFSHKPLIADRQSRDGETSIPGLCSKRAHRILRSGSWRDVDLNPIRTLEADLESHLKGKNAVGMEGHSAQLEIEPKLYTAMTTIGKDCVRTVCEIGFNAGHSALRWLWAAPTARVVMFDLWQHSSNAPAEDYLRNQASVNNADERLSIIKGDSTLTVREFHAKNPTTKCNILSVDGGHSHDVALADIINMKYLADTDFHILFVDDTNCNAGYCVDGAVHDALRLGIIRPLEAFMEQGNQRGITIFEYI